MSGHEYSQVSLIIYMYQVSIIAGRHKTS